AMRYADVDVAIDRELGAATITLSGPSGPQPATAAEVRAAGAGWWPLAACRQLDDAILRLRFNEPEVGTWILKTRGDAGAVVACDEILDELGGHWLAREITLYWKRTLKRLDVSAATIVTLVDPGSCFAGTLAELAL